MPSAFNTAVFDVLQDHGILLPTPEGKAIWKALITSENGRSHSFTLLRLAPALIWEANDRPAPFTGTVSVETPNAEEIGTIEAAADVDAAVGAAHPSPSATPSEQGSESEPGNKTAPDSVEGADARSDVIGDLLSIIDSPDPTTSPAVPKDSVHSDSDARKPLSETQPAVEASAQVATDQPCGEHFMTWLKQGIQSRKLIINDAKALVHTVADTVFLVSPGVFQRYAQEHPQIASWAKENQQQDWPWIQKRFEKLQLHRKQPNGLNIWTCEVTGPRKSRRLHGYLLQCPSNLFDEIPPNNPYLTVSAD